MLSYSTILIVPCFDEEKRIVSKDFLSFLEQNDDYLLLFVDDGSRDCTSTVIKELSAKTQKVHTISNHQNLGKAESVRAGILYAIENFDFQFIGFVDADLSTPLSEFNTFRSIFHARSSINIILGARVQMLGKQITRNLYRHWFSRIIATFICKILDEPVYDTQCGAKLFRRDYAKPLFREPFISKWLFDVEILARYKKKFPGNKFMETIIEVPVGQWTEKENSKLRYRDLFRIVSDLLCIRHSYLTNK